MKIDYSLDRNDFLEYQLYAASKSDTIQKNRKKARMNVSIAYFILGFILFAFADIVFALIFIGIGLGWYFLFPDFMNKRYLRNYEKYIDENLKNRFGKEVSLVFGEEFIESIDYMGESKLKIKEITEVNENNNYFFIKFSSGESLIVPKNKINQIDEFRNIILNLVKELGIIHNIELNWKWG